MRRSYCRVLVVTKTGSCSGLENDGKREAMMQLWGQFFVKPACTDLCRTQQGAGIRHALPLALIAV